jgi:hypothetical protein
MRANSMARAAAASQYVRANRAATRRAPRVGAQSLALIGSFDSIYVVTCENGHWGVKTRSSFAP